ncbi:4,5-dihydroxyphthalate decarboxylase [Brevibacterium sp. 239c]|uniref:nitrate ABC transporter substrate-binding protein n=1 Tax=Brevibacterium sp. 239c TaxID=1965356 RepID=UPI000C3B1DC4|nr:nitrate ABC transporter substrate-binding protein [Brevibacterium sp. 239c]SMX79725.1 4,5-dihydroxyphthalate decarboxylase [Brevibacterium sp. 239c]
MTTIRLALRDWDWLTPLMLGEVMTEELGDRNLEFHIDRVPALLDDWQKRGYDAAEVSLSKTSRAFDRGRSGFVAVPLLMMQGFRQRCIIVRKDSGYHNAGDLVGKNIGLTGWADSGNTWTRAALQDDGLSVDDAYWFVGRLTDQHPEADRLDGFGIEGKIVAICGKPMIDRLFDGELDAVLTPFMPPGFYARESSFRHLYTDVRQTELEWSHQHGYVPGHHVLGFDSEVPEDLREVVVRALNTSQSVWRSKREKYAETSAWLAVDLANESSLPNGWDAPYSPSQTKMFKEFFAQMQRQHLTQSEIAYSSIFKTV